MNDKTYYIADGVECSLYQMVRLEPDWAANRIRQAESLEAEVADLREQLTTAHEACNIWEQEGEEARAEVARLTEAAKQRDLVPHPASVKMDALRWECEDLKRQLAIARGWMQSWVQYETDTSECPDCDCDEDCLYKAAVKILEALK